MPFLWVLPLSLYLLSFILCFDHPRWYVRGPFSALLIMGIAAIGQLLAAGTTAPLRQQIVAYSATLFVACMVCHGELYRLKPPPRYLTSYYLLIAAGGALGGFLVAVVAPLVLNEYWELQAGFWALSYLLGALCFRHQSRSLAIGVGVGALLAMSLVPVLRTSLKGSLGWRGELKAFHHANWQWMVFGLVVFAGCVLDLRRLRLWREWRPEFRRVRDGVFRGTGDDFCGPDPQRRGPGGAQRLA